MKIKTTFGVFDDAYIRVSRYKADRALFLDLQSPSEGGLARITVCLRDPDLAPDESYVDVNNFPGVLELIADLNLGTPTGKTRQSGYVTYPVVKFNKDVVLKDYVVSDGFRWEEKTCI